MTNYEKVLWLMQAVQDSGLGKLNYAEANKILKKFYGDPIKALTHLETTGITVR